MRRFIDHLAGAFYDVLKFIIRSVSYIFTGMLIVGIPLYLIAFAFSSFH